MARMLDLIRTSAVSSYQMMSASKGALRVQAGEMLEILVYIAEHNKIFGEQARLTLAGWDEASAKAIVSNPSTPKEILDYWLSPKNIRPALFPALVENLSVSVGTLSHLATTLAGELLDVMIASPRVRTSPQLLHDLSTNHQLNGAQSARVQALISGEPERITVHETAVSLAVPQEAAPANPASDTTGPATSAPEGNDPDPEAESALVAYFAEHAAEIAAEAEKPFQPIGGIHEDVPVHEEPKAAAAAAAAAAPPGAPSAQPAPAHHFSPKKLVNPEDERRGSVLQKIAKLDIKGRIQLAMKGDKEERSILVRDGTKIVALAVLDSPKLTDGEVEKFASQKNVLEAVLRTIPMKRRFAKNYAVIRNLVFNPRTPLDVSLGLMKNILITDLKNLSGNKEVADTVRKLALRMFKQKAEASNKN